MQNNPMGAMMPQGVAPAASTGLNFQSDPSMRAQFKGFMSGMQVKQPAPAAPMMQQPLPMPPSMQNIDIFQPSMPMRMAMGGSVPRRTQLAGQPHMLSYITPGEANVLQAMGGSGAPGPGGIPSFFFDFDEGGVSGAGAQDVDSGGGGSTNFSSGSSFDSDTSSGSDDFYPDAIVRNVSRPSPTTNFSTTTVPGGGSGSSDEGDPVMDALSQAIANTAQANQAQRDRERADVNLGARFDQIQGQDPTGVGSGPTTVGGMPETLTGAGRTVDAIDIADVLGENANSQNSLLDTVFDSDDYDRPVDTVYDVDTTFTGPISMPDQMKTTRDTFNDLGVFGPDQGGAPVTITGPTSRPDGLGSSRDSTIGTGMNEGQDSGAPLLSFDLGGMGAEGEAVPPPGLSLEEVQSAMDLARATGDLAVTKQSEIGRLSDLMSRETTVTRGDKKNIPGKVDPNTGLALNPDAKTVSSLEQLAGRAGRGSEGISGFIEKVTGFNPAKSMYEDIVNNGYSPIYDAQGQIIGTVNPETGALGKGSRSIDMGALSESDSDLPAFNYNVFADESVFGGGDNEINQIIKTANTAIQDKKAKEEPITEEDAASTATTTATTTAAQPGPRRTVAAQVGNPLGFGYGQISGLTPNLNSAADDFLRLLGGR